MRLQPNVFFFFFFMTKAAQKSIYTGVGYKFSGGTIGTGAGNTRNEHDFTIAGEPIFPGISLGRCSRFHRSHH
ncbi:hypothetical protein BJ166DRAFT_544365, partial [Pestalotiopsis sp. NC0098]